MPTFLLHILVRPGREQAAVQTLTEIEDLSRRDAGCVEFTWLRHESEPRRFTLFERWESQALLDAHLAKIIPRWELFAPDLDGEPVSEPVHPVRDDLARAGGANGSGPAVRSEVGR